MSYVDLFNRAPRYAVGGVLCALVHNIIMISLDHVGLDYKISLLISFAVTAPLGYVFHAAVTFQKTLNWQRMRRYMTGVTSGFFVSALLMFIFCTLLRLPVPIATPIATVLLFFYNYLLARWSILLWRLDEGGDGIPLRRATDNERE